MPEGPEPKFSMSLFGKGIFAGNFAPWVMAKLSYFIPQDLKRSSSSNSRSNCMSSSSIFEKSQGALFSSLSQVGEAVMSPLLAWVERNTFEPWVKPEFTRYQCKMHDSDAKGFHAVNNNRISSWKRTLMQILWISNCG